MTSAEELYDSFPEEVRNEYEKEYTKEQFVKGCNILANMLARAYEALISTTQMVTETVKQLAKNLVALLPNKRVVYLARYGKKARTRKKNLHRIAKWIEKGG